MIRGRKVTDPVVQGVSTNYDTKPGLSKAWDTVSRAKSELHKAEQRLEEAERQTVLTQLNQTGETSIIDYGGLGINKDRNETYSIPEDFASGVVVDNHGRSAYLKSKTQTTRKVSRLEDKYVEDKNEKERHRKSSSKSLENHVSHSSKKKQGNLLLQEKKYDWDPPHRGSRAGFSGSQGIRGVNDRHVEFSEHVRYRENRVGLDNGYTGSNYRDILPSDQSTLTNSRDIRETEINFLNNNLTRDCDSHHANDAATQLTHVSVTVPGSTKTAASGYSGTGAHKSGSTKKSRFLDLVSESPEMDGRNTDCSQSDSESGRSRRFKGNIKLGPDGLAKIKETIRKQQNKSTSQPRENNEDLIGATGGDMVETAAPSQRLLHDASEPIVPRSQDVIEGSEKTAKVRKVAAGPAPPSYKGFSEAEVKYRIVENKGSKSQDGTRKDKKRQVSLKVQDKRVESLATWLSVEDAEGKSKKVTRVIAPSRKPTKQQPQAKKEIITTSSWRAGQELVLRELGPVKKKHSKGRESTELYRNETASPTEDRPETQGGEDYLRRGVGSATAAEIQHHKALSEEARRVYNDLHLDDEEGHRRSAEREKRWKTPVKRKAPKSTESEKQQQPSAKQRHYDQEQIRKYMQQKKADRVRHKKEEEMRMKEEEEARKRQLEELYNKQKHASQVSAAVGRKEKSRHRQTVDTLQGVSLSDLPKHHPYHTDRARFLVSSDSENKENMEDEDMEVSDSSSTLTGDGSEDNSPNSSPRRTKLNVDAPNNTRQTFSNVDTLKVSKINTNSQPRVENESSNVRTYGDFTFDISGVTSKFSQALQAKLNEEPPSLAGMYGSLNNQEHYLSDHNKQNDGLTRSRADRIQAIRDTAATLQNRLKEEARKIQAQSSSTNRIENGATSRPTVRWNDNEAPRRDREEEFMSRYDRVTAATDDFTVFKTNLPGAQPQMRQQEVPTSASNQPKLTSGTMSNDIGEDTTITETSTFSEITLTDDSDEEVDLTGRKIGTGLRKSDFHVGSSGQTGAPTQLNIPRPTHPAPNKASNLWDEPQPDDNNVFSIYSRRQERMIRPGREPMSKKKASEPEVQAARAQSQSAGPIGARTSSAQQKPAAGSGRKSPGLTARRAESPYSQITESLHTQSPVEKTKSKHSKSARKSEKEDEDTVVEESYTQSFESDDRTGTRGRSVSEKHVLSHTSLPASVKTTSKISDQVSDRVSPEMESSMDDDLSQDEVTPRAERMMSDSESAGPPRLSPNSLERKFYTEFHNLESMELSIKQLTSVDRTRAVSMAQQETVSLAQMLKAKQQGYEQQLKEIQRKAQIEATEATKQLEDARKRASEAAINAADMIAKVRGESVSTIQESTRKLIDTQTEAAKATAEAAKFLSEARALGLQDTNTLAVETAAAAAASAVNTALEKKWQGGKPKSRPSKSTKRRSDEAQDNDDLESIGSVDDFSINESMTEDEKEERSFRLILPSESHRKKGKHVHSDNESVASEASSTRMLDQDIHTLFKEGSFDKFTDDMVRQFMKEEALQAQHQQSLLKLRENALMEKTKAELQWLEQQKQRLRNKGADDNYPQIKKRQRGLKMKLQEQQEEIRRMREENKAAAKERQRKLYEKISKHQVSQKSKPEATAATPRGRLGRHHEVHTEAEVSSIDEASDAEKQRKEYKSDSEIYTEPRSSSRRKQDPEKYKKIHLDEKYLTQRQSQLMDRRKNAEELLKWKTMLDKEEQRVFKLEKQALKVWEHKDKDSKKEKEPSQSVAREETDKPSSKKDNGTTKDSTIKTASIVQERDSTVISESITTARDESLYTSIKEDIKTASLESSPEEVHRRMMNDKSNIKNHNRSGSESSVMEDVQSLSSVDDSKKMNDSSDDTMTHSYGNETFDDTVTATTSKKTSKTQTASKSPLEKLKKYRGLSSPGRSPRGLFSSRSHSRNSESESEDSISLNESQSELSDFEGRIRALNEELRKRKTEADKLKRERKKKKKELMKNKEETLKKQIEAYDSQIAQLKVELQKEMTHEPAKSSVRPQIKQPRVSTSKTLKTPGKQETDSSGPDSTQVSPNLPEDKDQKQISPKTPTTPGKTAKSQLDKISEGSETPTSRSEKSDLTYKEKVQSIRDIISGEFSSAVEDKTDEIEEDISAASEASDDKSKEIKIDLKTKEDIYDVSVSYTEDFLTEPHTMTQFDKLPLSARSQSQISDDFESRNVPQSARSVTEQISEQISENLPSVSASESFIKQLDLKAEGKDSGSIFEKDRFEKDIDSEGDLSLKSSAMESSRPSSGKSERSSVISYQTEHESSESEKSPAVQHEEKLPKFDDEFSEPSSKKKASGAFSSNVFDIDDLIDFDKDDMTPVASPRDTPHETSRHDSASERSERVSDFFQPLGDFEIGDRVTVTGPSGERANGTLLFKGNVEFAPGVWAGVELERAEGRHNGIEDGVRYFTCREKHGVIVPAHDVLATTEENKEEMLNPVDVRSSIESVKSVSSVNTEDGDLLKFISEADKNVQMFEESPEQSPRVQDNTQKPNKKSKNEILVDRITDDLLESVVRENVSTISRIADKKQQAGKKKGPPVAPKPAKAHHIDEPQTNGDIDDLQDFLQHSEQGPDVTPPEHNEQNIDDRTDVTVNNMMNDAIEHMLTIRRNNRQSQDINQSRDSGILDTEEEQNEGPPSPTDEIQGVLDKADDDTHLDAPLRPGSPVPGLQSDKDSHKPVTDSGLFEGDFEEDLLVPPKTPTTFSGAETDLRSDVPRSDLKKFAEEVFYAVPHEQKEIDSIVSSAVDEFWEQRRYGEPLTDLQPSEAFFTHEEIGLDLISNSRRVFKKLLFDLSGEVIRNIYKEEEYDSPVAWHKPKRKTNKFYKGASPPTTIDVLKPVVQQAVIDILGLNGTKKSSEKTKWGIRKKKDLVDTILVQELREEEPEWVNYDDDELAVKMQLTETIFNDLLTDTVQTMNKIFRKKQSLQQQQK